jgi:alkylation response protein AidB-like acyl-CoA dehydrogenase
MSADIDEIETLRESIRRCLARSYSPERRRQLLTDPVGHDSATWRVLAEELGLVALGIPESLGGLGASATVSQVVFGELGAALYCGPYFATAGLAVPALLAAADDQAKAEFLPRIAEGSLTVSLATTEPGAGWEIGSVATSAVIAPSAEGWRVSGTKAFVVDAAAAALLLVSARTPHGLSLFAVDPTAAGCAVTAQPSFDLTRRLGRVELRETPARLVSADLDVTDALRVARDRSFVALTGEQVGVATAALQLAVAYARQRVQFGRAIGSFQAIKHLCADMLVDTESAGALASSLARAADADADADLAVAAAMAKAACSELGFSVAARMVQVHGGIGFTWEHDAHLYYRRAKSSELMFGDATEHRRRLGEILCQ